MVNSGTGHDRCPSRLAPRGDQAPASALGAGAKENKNRRYRVKNPAEKFLRLILRVRTAAEAAADQRRSREACCRQDMTVEN